MKRRTVVALGLTVCAMLPNATAWAGPYSEKDRAWVGLVKGDQWWTTSEKLDRTRRAVAAITLPAALHRTRCLLGGM